MSFWRLASSAARWHTGQWLTDTESFSLYRIDGDVFISADRAGTVSAVLGYPTGAIRRAIEQIVAGGTESSSPSRDRGELEGNTDDGEWSEERDHLSTQLDEIRQKAKRTGRDVFRSLPLPRPGESVVRDRLGRNDPCWCGSGKKYKHCHLRKDVQ